MGVETRGGRVHGVLGTLVGIALLALALGVWACLWVPPWP
jgi:hypothetical protein